VKAAAVKRKPKNKEKGKKKYDISFFLQVQISQQ
jgi:hypothetical protein